MTLWETQGVPYEAITDTTDIETEINARLTALQYQVNLILVETLNIANPLTHNAIVQYALDADACLTLVWNECARLSKALKDMEGHRSSPDEGEAPSLTSSAQLARNGASVKGGEVSASSPNPVSMAAYYASIWGLSGPRMNELEAAFRSFMPKVQK